MKAMTESIFPILRQAGKAIMDIYQDEGSFLTEYKNDHSPLTEADKRSNTIICEALEKLYPDIPVISEENKQDSYAIRSGFDRYFLVDPLDGTREFIKRNGEFTINIAYLEGLHPMAGYVYIPVQRKTYFGERGKGAWVTDEKGHTHALATVPFYLQDKGIHVVASRSHRDVLTDRIISMLNAPEIVSVGSALKFLMIAEGRAHFYPRLAPTMEWDTAAAQCIVEEAGGSVIRFDTRLPVTYNKENLLSPHFIAMGKLLDPETLYQVLDGLPPG